MHARIRGNIQFGLLYNGSIIVVYSAGGIIFKVESSCYFIENIYYVDKDSLQTYLINLLYLNGEAMFSCKLHIKQIKTLLQLHK